MALVRVQSQAWQDQSQMPAKLLLFTFFEQTEQEGRVGLQLPYTPARDLFERIGGSHACGCICLKQAMHQSGDELRVAAHCLQRGELGVAVRMTTA